MDLEGADETDEIVLEMRLARFERLMARRPLLLNSVLLRQNHHNVEEWHKRVALYEGNVMMMAYTYNEAVTIVDPKLVFIGIEFTLEKRNVLTRTQLSGQQQSHFLNQAVGSATGKWNTPSLWVAFARMYETANELTQAREVFERSVKVDFKTVDDLATVWCEYAEMEVRNKQYRRALHRLQV